MPTRLLYDSIKTSKTVNAMTDFQYRVWSYLITYVDDYGRGSADAELLKGHAFPRLKKLREADIDKTLAELAGLGTIHLYEVEGEAYFCFPNWGKYQRIQTKRSKFPEPPQELTVGHGESRPESESESQSESQSQSERAHAPSVERGVYGWVKLTDAEHERLTAEYGAQTVEHYIKVVDEKAQMTGNKNRWKDWNLTVRSAIRGKWGKETTVARSYEDEGDFLGK